MNLIITMEALDSICIVDKDCELSNNLSGHIAWIHDPLGFVHPEGPFFD